MAYDRGRVVADSRAVLARHARTFDLAGWFLPAERLDDAAVVYAFCRLVDDSVDEAATIDEGRAALLARMARNRPSVTNPWLRASSR